MAIPGQSDAGRSTLSALASKDNFTAVLRKLLPTKVLQTLRESAPWILLYAFSASIGLGIFIAMEHDPESARQAERLRQIASSTPIFPDAQPHSRSETQKMGSALLILSYSSRTDYKKLKEFYSNALLDQGWGVPTEDEHAGPLNLGQSWRELTFRKGQYRINVSYEEGSSKLTVSYHWEKS